MINLQYIVAFLSIVLVEFSQTTPPSNSQIAVEKVAKQPIVFIAGFDEGDNQYYTKAQEYFEAKAYRVITKKYALAEIISWLNEQDITEIGTDIHIVSHSNPWRGLSMKTIKDGNRITVENLVADQDKIPILDSQIAKELNFIFHSCGLGENVALLETIKSTIDTTNELTLYASPYFNIFGSPFAPHYLAACYYVFYPTAHSPGKWQLANELQETYQKNDLDWRNALSTQREEKIGNPFRYRFNIPIHWETEFDNKGAIPALNSRDAIMNWVAEEEELAMHILELGIPLEKFRWKSQIKEHKLIIKGKTTVQCILQPITEEKNAVEYLIPNYSDTDLYVKI